MKTLILDGSHPNDPTASRVSAALANALRARGWPSEAVILRDQRIGNCAGDFYCWIRNPGVCNVADDNRAIAAQVAQSDLVVLLTPVTFGGYSSALKRMVDHLIQNISPYFTRIEGETHHQKRYATYPNLLVVGWLGAADTTSEAIFRHLVHRNALNLHAKTALCRVVLADAADGALAALSERWLDDVARGCADPTPALPQMAVAGEDAPPVRRVALVVGSPRTTSSTSASLGGYLLAGLARQGVTSETVQLYTSLGSPTRMGRLLDTLDAADLAVLAFPLYVDSLPAPVTAGLERIAAHHAQHATATRFAAICNCGFPEAAHCATALAICGEFAREAGLPWLGGLALGGGEGLVHGTPLDQVGGQAAHIRAGLDIAAEALAAGRSIPASANARLARQPIPSWAYRFLGGHGWKSQAKVWGVQGNLKARPYEKVG